MDSKHNRAYKGQGQYNQNGYHERKVIDRSQAVSPVTAILIIAILGIICFFGLSVMGIL